MLKLNLVTKKVYHGQFKTLQVLQAILCKLEVVDVEDENAYAEATHARVDSLEASDSDEDLFRRRMGMRTYFMKLKMSVVRVRNAKVARA